MEKEPPNDGVAEEVRQVMKDAQPVLPSASLAVEDPKTLQPPIPQDPKPVTLEPTTELALGKESLGGASLSTRVGKIHPSFISIYPYPSFLKVLVPFPLCFF